MLNENLAVLEIDQTRYLSILQKKKITSNLIFLPIMSDESLKVIIICVKEYYNGERIMIRVVSNTGDVSTIV